MAIEYVKTEDPDRDLKGPAAREWREAATFARRSGWGRISDPSDKSADEYVSPFMPTVHRPVRKKKPPPPPDPNATPV